MMVVHNKLNASYICCPRGHDFFIKMISYPQSGKNMGVWLDGVLVWGERVSEVCTA